MAKTRKTEKELREEKLDHMAVEKATRFLNNRATVKTARESVGVSNVPGIKDVFNNIVKKVRERGGEAKK